MRDARTRTDGRPGRPLGFTLTELLVVMAIIGILIAFILIAAQDGVRRAEERATQSLIAKLESGVSDRLEAVLLRRADISLGHQAMAAILNGGLPVNNNQSDPNYNLVQAMAAVYGSTFAQSILSPQRAQVIAQFDLVRAEVPDVFLVQPGNANYPINFAGLDYPIGSGNYYIPLGAAPPTVSVAGNPTSAIGIYGATFQAAGGLYKNLGYLPQGYDGVDNNGNGMIDEMAEGVGNNPSVADPQAPSQQIPLASLVQRRLSVHTHNTARSEMLYAMLVEGVGPLGSVFSRDEFTQREVQDTDGDGLPEFVDSWGQPLQFFRWPIYYTNPNDLASNVATTNGNLAQYAYVQKGNAPYIGPSEVRQVDPLDPNQTLVAPAWWSSSVNTGTQTYSNNAAAFMATFHSLLDPNTGTASGPLGQWWDRGGAYQRRAFYSRFLILSSGPDQSLGVGLVAQANLTVPGVIATENPAAVIDTISAQDDISNQGLATPGGGVR